MTDTHGRRASTQPAGIPRGLPRPRVSNIISSEIIQVAIDTFRQYKMRFGLTALGVAIGTASLILVVTIGLTGKEYILDQIRGIGANMIVVLYHGDADASHSLQDMLTIEDLHAMQEQVPGVVAASPMLYLEEAITLAGGRQQQVHLRCVDPQYAKIRNLDVVTGRFFDDVDSQQRAKVAELAEELARRIFGNAAAAVGQTIHIRGLPFTVIGTFKERVETFGQSELASGNVILIPYTVGRYFQPGNSAGELFFSMADPAQVEPATRQIQAILRARHRTGTVYRVDNLTELLSVAARTANALTLTLTLVAAVTLVVGGVGIMNIMLATVTSRTREIGIRKAVGATAAEIRLQFLAESLLISLVGGVFGLAIGLTIPFLVRFFTSLDIPISGMSVVVGLVVSSLVGIIFGSAPAARAAQMDPIASLHYE